MSLFPEKTGEVRGKRINHRGQFFRPLLRRHMLQVMGKRGEITLFQPLVETGLYQLSFPVMQVDTAQVVHKTADFL